ncbi:MAG: hypothetical protein KAW56_11215 [Candidatus Marinimicrobia bacterium]|nr:hypothetical protein [Candidatus Neomarinimicrobiota bacterium]MCK4447634.1 hypothetical protein [Candidatus Neomarinimicrobiota bacterium]
MIEYLKKIVISIIASFIFHFFIHKRLPYWKNKFDRNVIFSILSVITYFFIFLTMINSFNIIVEKKAISPHNYFEFYFTLLLPIISLVLLIIINLVNKLQYGLKQFKGFCKVSIESKSPRKIKVYKLIENLMSWTTIFEGCSILLQQIRYFSSEYRPDLIIGVNRFSTIIASYFGEKYRSELMSVRVGRTGKMFDVKSLISPSYLKNFEDILVVDYQYKSGKSADAVINWVKSGNPKARVLLAILEIAPDKSKNKKRDLIGVNSIYELKNRMPEEGGWESNYIPNFIAFYSAHTKTTKPTI